MMSRSTWIHASLAILIAIAALFIIRMHQAGGEKLGTDSIAAGHQLAEAWCQTCHAIEPHMAGMSNQAPSFTAIANRHATTALSIKVFLKTNHQNMPNLVIAPDQADNLANYILSLRTN